MHQATFHKHLHCKMLCVFVCALMTWGATPPDAPVAEAAMRGDAAQVRTLIERGEDVNAVLGDGMTALHWSAERGDSDVASLLLSAGARLESTTRLGAYRALHLAAKGGHTSVVRALLRAGATATPETTTGNVTPLLLAAASGSASSVAVLIEFGAEVDRRETAWGQTPLMFAAAAGRVQAIRALLDGGAAIDSRANVLDMPTRDVEDREDQAEGGSERGLESEAREKRGLPGAVVPALVRVAEASRSTRLNGTAWRSRSRTHSSWVGTAVLARCFLRFARGIPLPR